MWLDIWSQNLLADCKPNCNGDVDGVHDLEEDDNDDGDNNVDNNNNNVDKHGDDDFDFSISHLIISHLMLSHLMMILIPRFPI